MAERDELMEAALESYPEGIALLGSKGEVVLWNKAAEIISGFPGVDVVSRRIPWALEPILLGEEDEPTRAGQRPGRGIFVRAQHKSGCDLAAWVRKVIVRDGLGQRIGSAVIFRAAEMVDALAHGDTSSAPDVETSQAEMGERVEETFDACVQQARPFGLLWITVDQAHDLRKTHGDRGCAAMFERMERTLSNGMHANEEMGRWGDDDFLLIAHEPGAERLAARAQALVGLARTTEFRWWGDRISLTVSIGAAQLEAKESLAQLLERAQEAMLASIHSGGNHITLAPGRRPCSSL